MPMLSSRSFRCVAFLAVVGAMLAALASAQDEEKPSKPTRNSRRAKAGEKKEKSPKGGAKKGHKPTGELSMLEKALVEYALTSEEIDALVGKNVNLLMTNGKRV